MAIQKEDMEEGVEGQSLFCQLRPDSERFYKCKLDGEKMLMPTDAIDMKNMSGNDIRVESNLVSVNTGGVIGDNPRIKVKCGWTKKHSESPELDEFCVYEVEGLGE